MMSTLFYFDKNFHNTVRYSVISETQYLFQMEGKFIAQNGDVINLKITPFEFDVDTWKNNVGWKTISSEGGTSVNKFIDPKTNKEISVVLHEFSEHEHHAYVTDIDRNEEFHILTTENEPIIILVAIAAISCIATIAISRISATCRDECGDGNVKSAEVGIVWKKGFIPTCGTKCICKDDKS